MPPFKEEEHMYITCLDMEGVLVPEIWIAFAERLAFQSSSAPPGMSRITTS